MHADVTNVAAVRSTETRDCILVVDDDEDLRGIFRRFLEAKNFAVVEAADGQMALRALHEERPNLVILDIGLPHLDGWTVLERIRDVSEVPVLIVSARTTERDKVRGLMGGADDYITKPFGRDETLARVTALLRRSRDGETGRREVDTSSREPYRDNFLYVDFRQKRVTFDGCDANLTPIEFRLLAELVNRASEVLSHEQLLVRIWGDHGGLHRDQVKLRISALRRKLGQSGDDSCIETVRGFGYRYRPDVAS